MKRFIVFETSIVAFLSGVIVATYILFLDSINGYISPVLSLLSLRPLIKAISIPDSYLLIIHFLYYIVIYIIYGVLIGLLTKKYTKLVYVFVFLVVVIFGYIIFQQFSNSRQVIGDTITAPVYVQPVHKIDKQTTDEQYFGTEARGDLNGDGSDDIAFIISRNDPDRGMLYYLVGSLATKNGHTGTNLVFLGNKVEPKSILIATGTIDVAYIDHSIANSTSTKDFYAQIIKGNLEQIK